MTLDARVDEHKFFCWSANTGMSMCRSPQEKSLLRGGVYDMVSDHKVAVLLGAASSICSIQPADPLGWCVSLSHLNLFPN